MMKAAFAVLLGLSFFTHCAYAQDKVTYSGARSSNAWLDLGDGKGQAAVDKFAEGKGLKAYLSLTGQLIGVDAASGKTRWSQDIGGWADTLRFVDIPDAKTGEVLELVEASGSSQGVKRYYTVKDGSERFIAEKDGKQVAGLEEAPVWKGEEVKAVRRFNNSLSPVTEAVCERIVSAEAWQKIIDTKVFPVDPFGPPDDETPYTTAEKEVERMRKRMDAMVAAAKEGKPLPEGAGAPPVDFTKNMVVYMSMGKSMNTNGYALVKAVKENGVMTVYVCVSGYQTLGGGQKSAPATAFVFPRFTGKLVIKEDVQNYINGPAIWETVKEFEPLQ